MLQKEQRGRANDDACDCHDPRRFFSVFPEQELYAETAQIQENGAGQYPYQGAAVQPPDEHHARGQQHIRPEAPAQGVEQEDDDEYECQIYKRKQHILLRTEGLTGQTEAQKNRTEKTDIDRCHFSILPSSHGPSQFHTFRTCGRFPGTERLRDLRNFYPGGLCLTAKPHNRYFKPYLKLIIT